MLYIPAIPCDILWCLSQNLSSPYVLRAKPIINFFLCRVRAASKAQGDGGKRTRSRVVRAYPAPEANAELQPNLDVCLNVASFNTVCVCVYIYGVCGLSYFLSLYSLTTQNSWKLFDQVE